MEILLNGEVKDVKDQMSLNQLLEELGISRRGIAIELNKKVLYSEYWAETHLSPGDRLEIVHFVGGGAF